MKPTLSPSASSLFGPASSARSNVSAEKTPRSGEKQVKENSPHIAFQPQFELQVINEEEEKRPQFRALG
jgi:hypothetical protein